jgi:RNA polymerase sigma-70 factor (ECF subfamily)
MITKATTKSSSLPEKSKLISDASSVLTPAELSMLIHGCAQNDRDSQRKIYTAFYNYSITICNQHTNNKEDAIEILNDGFLKIFKEIHKFQPAYADLNASFKGWIRTVMKWSAIDHFRKNAKYRLMNYIGDQTIEMPAENEDAVDKISHREILKSIQQLTPAYRKVLNLFIVDGRTHQEIAAQLGITIGSSKSNLAKARMHLQKILLSQKQIITNRAMG